MGSKIRCGDVEMFWNKKPAIEKQKETLLSVLQLGKLIDRAVENAKNAIVAFDKCYEFLFDGSQEIHNDLKAMVSATELMSARNFIEQNEKVLAEIKQLIYDGHLRTPHLIRESLKNVQKKNSDAIIMFMADDLIREKRQSDETAIESLFISINLNKSSRSDLLQVVNSLNDFQDMVRKHFLVSSFDYIHENRLDELRSIESDGFDLSRLIRFCEELNSAYQNKNYLSVAMLVRAILDQVPPIFGFKAFVEVANNYGGKSLKKTLQNLQNSSRNIADAHLHEPIRSKESLPNETQIDFRNDLDVLLGEIVRILK
jgi:hypothetical protein